MERDVPGAGSSWTAALRDAHPLQAYTRVPVLSTDSAALHDRIASFLCCLPEMKSERASVCTRVEAAAAEAEELLAAAHTAAGASKTVPALRSLLQRRGQPVVPRYTALHPPPTITDAEVSRGVAALSAAEHRALEEEYQLTCVEGFECLSEDDESFAMCLRTHNAPPARTTSEPSTGASAASVSAERVAPSSASLTAAVHEVPAVTFTLDAMPSSSGSTSGSATGARDESRSSAACTVEVVYAGENFAGLPLLSVPTASAAGLFDSHGEADDGADSVQSFGDFSRRVLAEGERRTRVPAAGACTQAAPPAERNHTERCEESSTAAPAMKTPPAAAAAAAALPQSAPSATVEREEEKGRACAAFVRQRVRDVLLANKVRAVDEEKLSAVVLAHAETRTLALTAAALPALERLAVLVEEAEVLLEGFARMERGAVAARVEDPSQFLLVPRYRARCSNVSCHTAFSAVVARIGCRRCGQVFCPQCCCERGLGPPVCSDGEPVSLGWEPLCAACFTACRGSQQRIVRERNRRRLLTAAAPAPSPPSPPSASADEAEEDVPPLSDPAYAVPHPRIENLTVKEAVLLGAYCSETRRLSDGFPPFYVIAGAEETAAFLDVLGYRYAMLKSSLRAQWQRAGILASRALKGAAAMTRDHIDARRAITASAAANAAEKKP